MNQFGSPKKINRVWLSIFMNASELLLWKDVPSVKLRHRHFLTSVSRPSKEMPDWGTIRFLFFNTVFKVPTVALKLLHQTISKLLWQRNRRAKHFQLVNKLYLLCNPPKITAKSTCSPHNHNCKTHHFIFLC